MSDSCGAGFQPDAMLSYVTEIRVDGPTAYWHRGNAPIASGTYQPAGAFHFVSQRDVPVYGVDAGGSGAAGCTLREIETIDGTLTLGFADAGVSDALSVDVGASDASSTLDSSGSDASGIDAGVHSTGFAASDTIQISIAPGSDCTRVFASSGGPFETLPCTALFTMTATATN